jgi:hypothetical protein
MQEPRERLIAVLDTPRNPAAVQSLDEIDARKLD